VDVDSELKEISEKYFLQEKINEKINFIVEPARYFLNNKVSLHLIDSDLRQNDINTITSTNEIIKKYDVIVIDIYV
jgi:hypothetical protein